MDMARLKSLALLLNRRYIEREGERENHILPPCYDHINPVYHIHSNTGHSIVASQVRCILYSHACITSADVESLLFIYSEH